jgi:hypothetical protein
VFVLSIQIIFAKTLKVVHCAWEFKYKGVISCVHECIENTRVMVASALLKTKKDVNILP